MPFLLKIAPLGTVLSCFSALGNVGRNAASTFYYHSELNSIISFGKYSLFERALRGGVVRAFDWFSKGQHKDKEGKETSSGCPSLLGPWVSSWSPSSGDFSL